MNMENIGIKYNVIPRLHIQIIFMDHAYLETGKDRVILETEESSTTEDTILSVYVDSEGLINIVLPENSSLYCFFNGNINSVPYSRSQEFTNLWNSSLRVTGLYMPPDGFGEMIKFK